MSETPSKVKKVTDTLSSKLALIIASILFFVIIGALDILLNVLPNFSGGITASESAITDLGNVIVVFSFISLALQSSLGVFVSNWRGEQRTQKQYDVDKLKKEIEEFSKLPGQEYKIIEINKKLEDAENDLDIYRAQTKAIVLRLSLLAGIIISLAGVRILQPFTDVTLQGQQLTLFNAIDILLTGGLLAGGSEGVHRLTKVYESVTDLGRTVGN